ncbi:uncharacterized protein LOC123408117 [Hordeum vulgare subsp. vulgare]|uniref:uncharacterized protein LOC123408117 n=1 Tax=Hordeum vulgare subsp. vulgare TaxID=112509 RepID=UPI001D1A37CF|nr:uncharacterized protein LOC123408117 [Hordeum vulgare subsp. vulgare]
MRSFWHGFVSGRAKWVAGDGGVHRQRCPERHGELHQRGTLRGARLHRRRDGLRARPAVHGRADAVQELRGGRAHHEAGAERQLRDFLELALQFGMIMMFACAFPLIFCFAALDDKLSHLEHVS